MINDLINRQVVINALWKALYEYEDKTEKQFIESDDLDVRDWTQHRIFVQNMSDVDRQTILELPPAQLTAEVVERKKGKWLENETSYSDDIPQTLTCSVCGMRSSRPVGLFCKWCGADMRNYTGNQIAVCPMCLDCPDNCPLDRESEVNDVEIP